MKLVISVLVLSLVGGAAQAKQVYCRIDRAIGEYKVVAKSCGGSEPEFYNPVGLKISMDNQDTNLGWIRYAFNNDKKGNPAYGMGFGYYLDQPNASDGYTCAYENKNGVEKVLLETNFCLDDTCFHGFEKSGDTSRAYFYSSSDPGRNCSYQLEKIQ